jgi:hypothetical protein
MEEAYGPLCAPGSLGARAHAASLWRTAARGALRMRRAEEATSTWVQHDVPSEACIRHDYDAGAVPASFADARV